MININKHYSRRAFTLIELLTVIGIIALLTAIGFGVAKAVRSGAKSRATEMIFKNLDSMLDEYVSEMGRIPAIPLTVSGNTLTDNDVDAFYHYPQNIDGWKRVTLGGQQESRVYTVASFIDQVIGIGGTQSMLAAIPESNVIRRGSVEEYEGASFEFDNSGDQSKARTVVDPFGYEIFYIHPSLSGHVLGINTKNNAAQRFGEPIGGRPYFMSVGDDGVAGDLSQDDLKGFVKDNLFSDPTAVYDESTSGGGGPTLP